MSDLDGIVERRGHFLILEWKPSIDRMLEKKGQRLTLEALARVPKFTVLVIEGEPPDQPQWLVHVPQWDRRILANWEVIKEHATAWWNAANARSY